MRSVKKCTTAICQMQGILVVVHFDSAKASVCPSRPGSLPLVRQYWHASKSSEVSIAGHDSSSPCVKLSFWSLQEGFRVS